MTAEWSVLLSILFQFCYTIYMHEQNSRMYNLRDVILDAGRPTSQRRLILSAEWQPNLVSLVYHSLVWAILAVLLFLHSPGWGIGSLNLLQGYLCMWQLVRWWRLSDDTIGLFFRQPSRPDGPLQK